MMNIKVELHEDDYDYAVKASRAIAYLTLYGLRAHFNRVVIARYHGSAFHMELIATYYNDETQASFTMGALKRTADSDWEYHS